MHKKGYILWVFLLFTYPLLSQDLPGEKTFLLEGSVKGKENYTPIAGVEVRTDKGQYTTTNGLGEFKIKVAIGDWLIVESPDFETVRHRIGSNEEISVLVEDYEPSRKQLRQETHQVFLDSAIFYKKLDIAIV